MSIALEVRGLTKRYVVGLGTCLASADVLRGIDLTVRTGDVVAVAGSAGSGKSTLLLCLAGLMTPDHGQIRWFGDPSRAVAAQRVVYHVARTDLLRAGCGSEPNVHLVDVGRGIDSLDDVDRWVEARRDAGDAVILATRDADAADALASRVLMLRRGAIVPSGTRRIRVAEPASS